MAALQLPVSPGRLTLIGQSLVRPLPVVCASICMMPAATANELKWEGGVTAVYQSSDDDRAESELTASADFFATLPQDGGEWILYIEASTSAKPDGVSAFYPTVNGDAQSVLTASGSSAIHISELNYTFLMKNDRSFMLGLIDPTGWLDRGRIANDENEHFLNVSFVQNATIGFPDYTLGGVFRVLGNTTRPEFTVVVAGSDGIADLPNRSYQELLNVNDDGRGVFVGAGASWLKEHTSWRLGTWFRSDDHPVAGSATEVEKNFGAYGVFGWQSGVRAINIRAGIANPDVSITDRFVAFAYQQETQHGLLGIGVAHTNVADGFSASGQSGALDSEVYFRIPILNGTGHVTPSIQYVEAPALHTSEATTGSSAFVASVRFRWLY